VIYVTLLTRGISDITFMLLAMLTQRLRLVVVAHARKGLSLDSRHFWPVRQMSA
jgi:hypothetical protein